MDGGNGIGKDMRNMQTLATWQDGIGNSGAAHGDLPARPALAVPAAASDLCEVRDGSGQGDSGKSGMAKPRLSTRGGLGTKRIWACVSVDSTTPFLSSLRLGYGYSPKEAYAEWEAS